MTPPPDGNRGQFRRLAVLIAVNFVDMIGFMIVLPLLPFYALKLHATPETIGRLIASFSIAQLLRRRSGAGCPTATAGGRRC